MILTGPEIVAAMERGDITIEPFDPVEIRPNSYDWHLGPRLLVSTGPMDVSRPSEWVEQHIGDSGYVLEPMRLYLGETLERTSSERYAQLLNGNRRTGRLGIWVHVSAPLGHVGHSIRWTLEIRVVKPVRVYLGMRFGRLVFMSTSGDRTVYGGAASKYALSAGVERSKLHEEFETA